MRLGRVVSWVAALGVVAWSAEAAEVLAAEPAPLGEWVCEGEDAGGAYVGRVRVTAQGEAFLVRWEVAGRAYEGVGVAQAGRFAVAFTDTALDRYGVLLLERVGSGWAGEVSTSGTTAARREVWRKP